MIASATDTDPAAGPPPWWRRHLDWIAAVVVFTLTAALTVLAFPPFHTPEAAYVFAAPAALWAYRRPPFRLFAFTVLGSQAVAWTIILSWLHHVTWGGLFLLGPFIGVWVGAWFLALHWVLPRLPGRPVALRLLAVFGLAGLWVVNEWTRTWLLGGFPWLPLAASQWQRAPILQFAAFTGGCGVSFVLITMSLGLATYAHRLSSGSAPGFTRRCPEFWAAMVLVLGSFSLFLHEVVNRGSFIKPLARVAFVQPDIPQEVKWDNAKTGEILSTFNGLTTVAAATKPDLILWPEASTPFALNNDPDLRAWVERLAREAGCPLVLGSIATLAPGAGGHTDWFNAAFVTDATTGVQPGFYAKRQLVPFGEFVPLRSLLGWIGKFVPIGDDFGRGTSSSPLVAQTPAGRLQLGPLICYEDNFPAMARADALAGADVLLVVTNNGWFGEGGAAYQQAASAVLRAVETRRPVIRDGNAGWSGWIDEFGGIGATLTQDDAGRVSTDPAAKGTIYFRGTATVNVTVDSRWVGQQSFYTLHGDWFVALSAALAIATWFALRQPKPVA